MTKNITKDLNYLRSILQFDDDLQIRSLGNDINHICLKLHSDIQISFFINTFTKSLTLNNLYDLCIHKLSNKNSLKQNQWINIQNYFNQLIKQSNSYVSLYSIIELVQKQIPKFSTTNLIFNRISYDKTLDHSKILISYEDHLTNIHEISFNDLKKIHNDISIQHIQYYKIDQTIVWDRIKKYDNQLNLIQGLYHFDRLINQWIPCFDDLQDNNMYLPEECQFLTWNILSIDNQLKDLYSNERYRKILKTLENFLPDIICLQNVTRIFLDFLLEEIWLRENNYYIIIMEDILSTNETFSHGQLMLIKNIRPQTFEIHSFDLSNNKTKKFIITQFQLKSNITIDLINIDLNNVYEKCSDILEYIFQIMKTKNYMIIGDFNFGDDDIIEENILQKFKYNIYDLWKEIYDLDENPGYTYDTIHNICAQITSDKFSSSFRSDRYLLHKLSNLSYSIIDLNMIGLESFIIDNKSINQSNHYGLKLIINFRVRLLTHHSALVILPPSNISTLFNQWSTSIHLFWPFFDIKTTEDDEENLLLPLRLLFAQYQSFDIEINNYNSSIKYIQELSEQIQQLFPQLTIAQFENQINSLFSNILVSNEFIRFSVRYIYILQQSSNNDTIQYSITHQLPLGSVLEPIGLHQCDYINNDVKEFFTRMNLYQNKNLFEQKQEKFNQLINCFQGILNKNTLHYFTYTLFPYGSFRLGLHGEDLDIVFVLSEENCITNKTNLDEILFRLRFDSLELNNYIINILEKQITNDLKQDILDCRKIQAVYPIISILFTDQIRVEIFVQIILNQKFQDKKNLLSNFHQPIHGVHDIERLITYVRFPSIFQHLLTFIRTWAQNIGIYGQVYGYLGGYSWAILCAYICHKYLPLNQTYFSIEQFKFLIKNFFSTYSQFNWFNNSFSLYSNNFSPDNYGSMRILCPNAPFNNTSRSTINSTRYLIIQAFKNASKITLENILQYSNQFPDQTIQSILQLKLSGQTINELNQWIGYMKSRLAHFLNDCENECNLFVQTNNHIEIRNQSLERFYSIGFQLNEHKLSCHRKFYYCLNQFLEQFKLCIFRSETMKISYKLMSINQWKKEHLY